MADNVDVWTKMVVRRVYHDFYHCYFRNGFFVRRPLFDLELLIG
jgi:hypothetical protein